jgi:hypothetical protein
VQNIKMRGLYYKLKGIAHHIGRDSNHISYFTQSKTTTQLSEIFTKICVFTYDSTHSRVKQACYT